MFPSSSRVKLNRVALKDVVGLKLVPRRRRVPKSPNNLTGDSRKQEEKKGVSEVMPMKDTASVCSSSEPVQSFVTDQMGPENETHTVGYTTEGEPEDSCVDIDRNTHPSPAGLAGSEGSLRRAVTASRCRLCGDCEYIFPQQKTLGKQGQKSSSPGPEQSRIELKIKKGNPVTSEKTIVWTGQYPKVTLCDIAQKCDVCSVHNCGYMLPDVLKTKVVHCFKRDMRAGFRFGPGCSGHKKHKSSESALAKNRKQYPKIQSEKNVRESQSVTECQRHLPGHTGEHTNTGKCRDVGDDQQMSSELCRQRNEVDADEQESFTCQRVRIYCRKISFTCARTYMSWPFSNSSRTLTAHAGSLLLPQDEHGSDKEVFTDGSSPEVEPYNNTSPFNPNHPVAFGKDSSSSHKMTKELCVETKSDEFIFPVLLSPVSSPQRHSCTSSLHQSQRCSDEEEEAEEEMNKNTSKNMMLPEHHKPLIGNVNQQHCDEYLDHHQFERHCNEELEGVPSECNTESSHSSAGDVSDGMREEGQDKTDDEEQGNSSDGEQLCSARDQGSSPSEIPGSKRDKTKAEADGDTQLGILDEFTAYEQDILLVDVIQDDPELFDNLPEESLLKLGPARVSEAPKNSRPAGVGKTLSSRIDGASLEFEQRLTPVILEFHSDSPDITEESNSRPWRPQCSSTLAKMQNSTWPATDKQTRNMGQSNVNNNHRGLERREPIQTVNSPHNIAPLMTIRNANMRDFRRQKSNVYCRQYFSESLSCGFKMCRFQHVPVEGDEKFCVETVMRFIKSPMCLQKAGAVFTGYYHNNPPGVYFSMPVLLSLLWALLKAGMVSDVLSVLSVSLAHKIVPGYEFLLALFNFVREKGLMASVPELMQLTFKMASAGLALSLDCLDCVKNTSEFQQTVQHPNSPVSVSGNHKLSSSAPFPEYLTLAQYILEIELCTKQEDWRQMGEVFRSMCRSSQHPNQVEQISGRIAIALLSESKDKLSLPFAAFAETVCQNEGEDILSRSFLGRIGVSLMLRYHRTHQWAKGRRVVEVLSISKVSYSTLKGLFGNEDGASRCHLVTVATELFLLSGSVEGALNTLRENKWFLSSCSWPCEAADLDSRSRVLMRLAEKTSHRDTLEVLCNLPGLKEPNDLIDISRYGPLFNSHVQVCVDRQILPVASDTVDFMLSKNLAVDHAMLQIFLHKLGKQNLWLRAREIFRHSLRVGYYPDVSAPPGFMALIVPCHLGEVELALTFEMFIAVNATAILQLSDTTTSCLSITLKRTQSAESEYLSAGSRLLFAACIPQPKLIVHYTAVNSSQEQVFTLDISSARRWLRHNHLWANVVWMH